MTPKWPDELVLIRHGQSEANVRKAAQKAGGKEPDYSGSLRDQDTPLTLLGSRQTSAAGAELSKRYPPTETYKFHPVCKGGMITHMVISPYLRTRQSATQITLALGYQPEIVVEERIREIEFGILDGLGPEGMKYKFPEEIERRRVQGKYWYRPPGGESRPDVRLRVHSFLGTLARDYVERRVVIVCHSVIVLAIRSLLERWGEEEYMRVDKEDDVKNGSITTYKATPHTGKLELVEFNYTPTLLDYCSKCGEYLHDEMGHACL